MPHSSITRQKPSAHLYSNFPYINFIVKTLHSCNLHLQASGSWYTTKHSKSSLNERKSSSFNINEFRLHSKLQCQPTSFTKQISPTTTSCWLEIEYNHGYCNRKDVLPLHATFQKLIFDPFPTLRTTFELNQPTPPSSFNSTISFHRLDVKFGQPLSFSLLSILQLHSYTLILEPLFIMHSLFPKAHVSICR